MIIFTADIVINHEVHFNIHDPEEIRNRYFKILSQKQKNFETGVWLQSIGIVVFIALMIFRFRLGG